MRTAFNTAFRYGAFGALLGAVLAYYQQPGLWKFGGLTTNVVAYLIGSVIGSAIPAFFIGLFVGFRGAKPQSNLEIQTQERKMKFDLYTRVTVTLVAGLLLWQIFHRNAAPTDATTLDSLSDQISDIGSSVNDLQQDVTTIKSQTADIPSGGDIQQGLDDLKDQVSQSCSGN